MCYTGLADIFMYVWQPCTHESLPRLSKYQPQKKFFTPPTHSTQIYYTIRTTLHNQFINKINGSNGLVSIIKELCPPQLRSRQKNLVSIDIHMRN